MVYIEIEYEDGTTARYTLDSSDPVIEQIEKLLETPDTLKV